MDSNCTLIEERLSDFLDRALLPEEAAAFSAHTAGCERCIKLVEQVGGLVSRMQQLPQVEAPPLLAGEIVEATLGPRKPKPASQGWLGWISAIWQPRFAMGVVTVVASFVIVFNAAGSTAAKSSLNPFSLFRDANRQIHLTYARSSKFVNDLRVVYEIRSGLSFQPENISEPMSVPAGIPSGEPQPGQRQHPSSDPHEKSQTIPHSSRREARGGAELAMLIDGLTTSSVHPALRSYL